MRCFPFLSGAALVGVAALGCDEAPRLTAPADPAPSLRVQRFTHADAFILGGDPSNPLAVQVGFDAGVTVEDICSDPSGVFPNGVGQLLLTPPGGALLHGSGRDVNLLVYQFGAGPVSDFCQVVGSPLVGTGTGDFTYQILGTGRGAFVAHISVHGVVDLVSGGQARLFATARVTVRPSGTLQFDEERVRLTPL